MRRALWVGLTAAAVLVADQASKSWAVSRLSSGRIIDVVGGLQFRLAFNTGMAWSNFEGGGPVIALISLVIVGSLVWFARSVRSPVGLVIIGAVIGGALGNVADRVFRETYPPGGGGFLKGAVVDFVYTRWWPTFNVADSCIVVGGILLAIFIMRMPTDDDPLDDGLGTDADPGTHAETGAGNGATADQTSDAG